MLTSDRGPLLLVRDTILLSFVDLNIGTLGPLSFEGRFLLPSLDKRAHFFHRMSIAKNTLTGFVMFATHPDSWARGPRGTTH